MCAALLAKFETHKMLLWLILHTMKFDRYIDLHDEKVALVTNFLKDDSHANCFLMIIGNGATGKTHAVNAALKQLREESVPYHFMYWNESEKPQVVTRLSDDPDVTTIFKCIVVRRQADDLACALQKEWPDYTCNKVCFMEDDRYSY